MATTARGLVDFGDERFIARCDGDPTVVARLKDIQRRRWNRDEAAWIVEPHWPSVRRLLSIAADLGWEITAAARTAQERVRRDSESLEYLLDVVVDSYGSAWFICKMGDDDERRHQVRDLPGAFWDDAWWIPTDWDQCCVPLLEIVQSDMRIEVSEAAWRLLQQPDVAEEFVRSGVPPQAAERSGGRKVRVSASGRRVAPAQPVAEPGNKDTG